MNRLVTRDVVFLEEHWRSVELSSLHILAIDCCSFMDLSELLTLSELLWTVLHIALDCLGLGLCATMCCLIKCLLC